MVRVLAIPWISLKYAQRLHITVFTTVSLLVKMTQTNLMILHL